MVERHTDQRVDLLTVGEPLRAFVADGDALDRATHFRSAAVGAESNVAVAVQRLGHRAALVAAVGDDASGRFLMRELRAEGVDVAAVAVLPDRPTGTLQRDSSPSRAISVEYARRGSAGSTVSDEQVSIAWEDRRPRLAHLSGITPLLSDAAERAADRLLGFARRDGVPVSFDINLRRRLAPESRWRALVRRLAKDADIVFGGAEELALLGDRPEQAIAELVASGTIVVCKNEDLTVTVEAAAGPITMAALPAALVDPVGAGDALVGGFLSGMLLGLASADCLRRGIGCAAFAVEHWSDTGGLPDGPTLDARLSAEQQDQVRR